MLRALRVTRGTQQPLGMLAGLRGTLRSPQLVLFCLCSSDTGHCVQLGSQKEDFKDLGISLLLSRLLQGLDPFETHLWCDYEVTGW